MSPGTAVYQAAMSGLKQGAAANHPLLPKLVPAPTAPGMVRGRGRPQMINRYLGDMRSPSLAAQQKAMAAQMRPGNYTSVIISTIDFMTATKINIHNINFFVRSKRKYY